MNYGLLSLETEARSSRSNVLSTAGAGNLTHDNGTRPLPRAPPRIYMFSRRLRYIGKSFCVNKTTNAALSRTICNYC